MKKWSIKKSKNAKMLNARLLTMLTVVPKHKRELAYDIQACVQALVTEVAVEATKVLFAKYKKGDK